MPSIDRPAALRSLQEDDASPTSFVAPHAHQLDEDARIDEDLPQHYDFFATVAARLCIHPWLVHVQSNYVFTVLELLRTFPDFGDASEGTLRQFAAQYILAFVAENYTCGSVIESVDIVAGLVGGILHSPWFANRRVSSLVFILEQYFTDTLDDTTRDTYTHLLSISADDLPSVSPSMFLDVVHGHITRQACKYPSFALVLIFQQFTEIAMVAYNPHSRLPDALVGVPDAPWPELRGVPLDLRVIPHAIDALWESDITSHAPGFFRVCRVQKYNPAEVDEASLPIVPSV